MQVDVKKEDRQRIGINHWRYGSKYGAANGIGTLWWITAMGKTYSTLNFAVTPYLDKNIHETVIILVHRDELRKQWKDRVEQFVDARHHGQITIQTVQYYLDNKIVPTCGLLVVDEVHKFYGDDWFQYVDGTKILRKYLLCLTATFLDPQGRHEKLQAFAPPVDIITEQDATANGWISKYVEYNLCVELTDKEIKRYNELCEFTDTNLSMFGKHGYDAAKKCISGDSHFTAFQFAKMWAIQNGWVDPYSKTTLTDKQLEINSMWNPNVVMGYAKNALKGVNAKNQFLATCDSKFNAVLAVIRKFEGYKIMSFSESITFADKVFNTLNKEKEDSCVVYHSKISKQPLKDKNGNWMTYGKTSAKAGQRKLFGLKTLKKVFTEKFINSLVKVLSTAKALDEGFDCEDIEVGIISSRTRNFNQQTQRTGRVKRVIPSRPNSTMLIVNVFVKGTSDYDTLREAQSKSSNKIHWIDSVDKIEFNPRNEESFDDI